MNQRVRWASVVVCAAGIGLGCSSGGDSGGGTRNTPDQGPGVTRVDPNGPGAGGGGAAAGTGGMTNLFGNPSANAEPLPMIVDETADECEVGERCAPTDVDPMDCGSLTLEPEVEVIRNPGNLLVIADKSQSMLDQWNGQIKYTASRDALLNAIIPMQDLLTVGSVMFPAVAPDSMCASDAENPFACGCEVSPIDTAQQLAFMPAPDFIAQFPNLYVPPAGAFTPLEEGVVRAAEALQGATLEGTTAVIIMTDGEPNCSDVGEDPDAIMNAQQIIADRVSTQVAMWFDQGIKTHVIGLPGVQGAEGVLNQIAMAGGTGSFVSPTNPQELEARFAEIASETIESGFDSCELIIDPPAEVPEKLHMVVVSGGMEQIVPPNMDANSNPTWNVSGDGSRVTLEGRYCEAATTGEFEAVHFEFGCEDPPPIPPLPPLT